MSKNKSKIVKWEYVTKPFDVLVVPATVKRVHSPLEPSLTPHYSDRELNLHLRPCVQGLDEYGAVVGKGGNSLQDRLLLHGEVCFH